MSVLLANHCDMGRPTEGKYPPYLPYERLTDMLKLSSTSAKEVSATTHHLLPIKVGGVDRVQQNW